MLLAFAHPGDESFSVGGTVAKYVKAGWSVDMLCATSTGSPELGKAGVLLGISSITYLGYKNEILKNEPTGELEEAIFQKMMELVPDIVITFDTTGITNHPDHVRTCFSTTFAFQKYAQWIGDKLTGSELYNENMAPKLYYACTPESLAVYLKKKKAMPEESWGKPWIGTEDKFITTVINIASSKGIKKKALRVYEIQQESVYPSDTQEYFILRMHGIREIFMGKNDRVVSKL